MNWCDFERDDLLDRRRDDLTFDDLVRFESGQFHDRNLQRFEVDIECGSFLSDL